jgi:hypothetical protein
MKKKAILLLLCTAMLSGCGRVDSVEVNDQMDPFEVEQVTDNSGEEIELVPRTTAADATDGTNVTSDTTTTVSRTVTVNLVKRTNVTSKTSTAKRTTARVPSNTRPSTTTTTTANPLSTSTTTGTGTGTLTTTVTGSTVSTTSGITTTASENENPTIVTRDDMSCNITESGINVMIKGEPVQNISFDTSYMLKSIEEGKLDAEYRLNIVDLDFDGNFDLFIPSSDDEFNVYGKFLHYNPITKAFEEWHEFEGVETYNTSSSENGTIISVTRQSALEYVEITRQWVLNEETNEKTLRKIAKKEQYIDTESNQSYIKYWKYIDNVETPDKREKVTLDENGEVISREEVTWA